MPFGGRHFKTAVFAIEMNVLDGADRERNGYAST